MKWHSMNDIADKCGASVLVKKHRLCTLIVSGRGQPLGASPWAPTLKVIGSKNISSVQKENVSAESRASY